MYLFKDKIEFYIVTILKTQNANALDGLSMKLYFNKLILIRNNQGIATFAKERKRYVTFQDLA